MRTAFEADDLERHTTLGWAGDLLPFAGNPAIRIFPLAACRAKATLAPMNLRPQNELRLVNLVGGGSVSVGESSDYTPVWHGRDPNVGIDTTQLQTDCPADVVMQFEGDPGKRSTETWKHGGIVMDTSEGHANDSAPSTSAMPTPPQ